MEKKWFLSLILSICMCFGVLEIPVKVLASENDISRNLEVIDLDNIGYSSLDEMVTEYESKIDYEACVEGPEYISPADVIKAVAKKPEKMGVFRITYYCGCYECSEEYGTNTSTMVQAKEGRTIAVDPSVIPYGSTVFIDGQPFVAEDCGGAIKGNRIDIFLNDHASTEKYGVDYCEVEIVRR